MFRLQSTLRTLFFTLSLATHLFAQTPDTTRIVLPPVTVIGTAPEALRTIPGSGRTFGPMAIATIQPRGAEDVLRHVSGVYVRSEDGLSLRPNIGIRGLSPTRSSKILLLEDGIPLTTAPYGDPALYYHPPIERFSGVEVLKGASQLAYGPQTIGGVINYITPMPNSDTGFLRMGGGNRGYRSVHGGFSKRLTGENGIGVDILHKRSDLNRDYTGTTLTDLMLKGLLKTDTKGQIIFKFNAYQENSQVTYPGITEVQFKESPYYNPFENDRFRVQQFAVHTTGSRLLTPKTLLSGHLYGYTIARDWWRQGTLVMKNGVLTEDDNSANPGNAQGVRILLAPHRRDGRLRNYQVAGIAPHLTHEVHIGKRVMTLEGGVRAHFETQKRQQLRTTAGPTAESGTLVEDNLRQTQAYAAFIENKVEWSPRTSVSVGFRYEAMNYRRKNAMGASGKGIEGAKNLRVWIPGGGISFLPNKNWTIFAGLHRGFAPPRVEDVIDNTTGTAIELDAELSWNTEFGVRWQKSGLRAEFTSFRMDFQNQIVPASLAGGISSTLTNAGETLHMGAEMALEADATEAGWPLVLSTNMTWLPVAHYKGNRKSAIIVTEDVGGNRLPYAPEWLATAIIKVKPMEFLNFGVEWVYTGSQFSDDLNSVTPTPNGRQGEITAYGLFNATVQATLKNKWSFSGNVKNMANKVYISDRSRGIMVGSPRNWQIGIAKIF